MRKTRVKYLCTGNGSNRLELMINRWLAKNDVWVIEIRTSMAADENTLYHSAMIHYNVEDAGEKE